MTLENKRDRALVHAICYGVCRFYPRLSAVLNQLMPKPLKAKDADIHALLCIGLYQLMAMRVPPYAAITETVKVTDQLKKTWARGLVNAVLRQYLRQQTALLPVIAADNEAHYAHATWWIERIKSDWPAEWQAILDANNAHPPFSLRVNQRRSSREDYLKKWPADLPATHILTETRHGFWVETAMNVDALPGFAAGDISVQDGAAQLCAELLALTPELHVLDACAAPGGKLCHLLEQAERLSVVAIEKDNKRMASITENLERLHLQADCHCADVTEIATWWDGRLFDRILLDAPCSASGIIRRHPDIKLLRKPSDISALAATQQHLLRDLWPLLKPGGLLLYATCSIFKEENSEVISTFLANTKDVSEEKITAAFGIPCTVGRQILPGMQHMDGFYFAKLRKT